MKNLIIVLLFVFGYTNLYSQELRYKLTVKDLHGNFVKSLSIIAKEQKMKKTLGFKTDNYGFVEILLNEGADWNLSIGEMYNYKILRVKQTSTSIITENITYDIESYKRERRQLPDRSTLNITVENQKINASEKSSETESVVTLKVRKADDSPLTNFAVALTSLDKLKTYITKTNALGHAVFKVPAGFVYEIDVDNFDSFLSIDIPSRPGAVKMGFVFEPLSIKTSEHNDTITQYIPENPKTSSAAFLYEIKVNLEGAPAQNENVYLKMINSKKVYKSKTDANGSAYFFLPKNRKYLIDMEYQKDINVIDLTTAYKSGIGNGIINVEYIPDPKLQFPERYIPTTEDLLINEFNNFLQKQYPKPYEGNTLKLFLKWGNNLINGKSKQAVLEMGISVAHSSSAKSGPALNLSFVIDKSGSMAGYGRIEELKKSLLLLIDELRPQDIASLIVFDDLPELLIGAQKMEQSKAMFVSNIQAVDPNGGTNIYNGMLLAYDELMKNFNSKNINRMILLTDGYGVTPIKTIVDKAAEYEKKGITISAIGVGEDYNQALLRLLTKHESGSFQHVDEAERMQNVFRNEINSLLFPVAKDLKVDIFYNNKILFNNLYGFDFSKHDGNKVSMSAKNLYPGMNKLAIVKFDLKNADKTIQNSPITIMYSYFDYVENKIINKEEKIYLKWEDSDKMHELIIESEYKKLYAIAIMNQSLKVMAEKFSENLFAEAELSVKSTIAQINELYPEAKEKDVEELYKRLYDYAIILNRYKKNLIRKEQQ